MACLLTSVLCIESLRRIETFDAAFQVSRMRAVQERWPEQGVEIRTFGPLTAIRVKGDFLAHKCLIVGLDEASLTDLGEALQWVREFGKGCVATLPQDAINETSFDALVTLGMRCVGTTQVMARIPTSESADEDVTVRESPIEEREPYLNLYAEGFADRLQVRADERRWQWTNDTLPDSSRFVAEVDGRIVGMASLMVMESVGYLYACGVLPQFRRRGVHGALIQARVAAADAAGCQLVMGGGPLFGAPMRNYGRHGFELLPLGTVWSG